ncbi:MAG: hypothetical protein A3H42_04230 [Deltaproteobacteria bacterium RIFCSPLOWO2_02_FULL_46_8]|nr:MAG: hypothetical protein A3H42_04230 [Deltaproteobacteria bacterium RIFCSPLOWO2_02_FULL_46_8]
MKERVLLTALRDDDLEVLFQWVNDPALVRFSASYKPVHWKNHVEWFDSLEEKDTTIIFGIRPIGDKKLIGFCKLVNMHRVCRSAEMQIKIGDRAYLSQGYGSEALGLLLRFAWDDLNLHRVYCYVFADNERAIKLYEKFGFLREGVMREAAFIDGEYKDIIIMGILRDGS